MSNKNSIKIIKLRELRKIRYVYFLNFLNILILIKSYACVSDFSYKIERGKNMSKEEIIEGLKDLIIDRESFITNSSDAIFEKDKKVLEEAVRYIKNN